MKLTELFDRVVDWKYNQEGSAAIGVTAINNMPVHLYFDQKPDNGLEVNFSVNDEFGVTGTGSEIPILSAVTREIINYVTQQQPNEFWFTADAVSPKRMHLYSVMSSRLAKQLPYDYKTVPFPSYKQYLFTRKK